VLWFPRKGRVGPHISLVFREGTRAYEAERPA
jgi:hypothetical protein